MNSSKNFDLIVPVAADRADEEGRMPRVFSFAPDGTMLCVKAITGLNLDRFDRICFTVLRKHAEAYDIDTLLGLQMRRLGLTKGRTVILDEPTRTQADTVAATIEAEGLDGGIFIKDADSRFRAEARRENGVAVFPLEKLELVDPRNKSYVAVDDMHYVTNIIEKRVVSRFFNAGGYCFENVGEYLDAYGRLRSHPGLYLSHIIYSMLLDGKIFRPVEAKEYQDWNLR